VISELQDGIQICANTTGVEQPVNMDQIGEETKGGIEEEKAGL
jgi:hypothetical protein